MQEVTVHLFKVWEEVEVAIRLPLQCYENKLHGIIICRILAKGVLPPFAVTYQGISQRFSSLWIRSIVEFGRARHHGKLHRGTVLIHHPKELLNQAGELRMGMQLLLERHGDALEGDVIVGGADAPRSDQVRVLR